MNTSYKFNGQGKMFNIQNMDKNLAITPKYEI